MPTRLETTDAEGRIVQVPESEPTEAPEQSSAPEESPASPESATQQESAPETPPPAEQATEEPGAPGEPEQQEPVEKETQPPKKPRAQRRIEQLSRRLREREAEIERLQAQSQTSPPAAETPPPRPPEPIQQPKIEDYEDMDRYYSDMGKWAADMGRRQAEEVVEERDRRAAIAREQRAREEANREWNQRMSETAGRHEDFEEVMEAARYIPSTPAINEAILDSDVGPGVLYHLAKNPEEAQRIASLSPVGAIRAIGVVENQVRASLNGGSSPTPRASEPGTPSTDSPRTPVTKTPPPINPVGAGASGESSVPPDKMSMAEFNAWRDKTSKLGPR